MLIDNCSAHKPLPSLSNLTVEYLPANTTSILQPLDQGIVQSFKVHYRREMCSRILRDMESSSFQMSAKDQVKKITLLDALYLVDKA